MGKSHGNAVGIEPASVRLLVAEDHAMYNPCDDFHNVHNVDPFVYLCREYRILVVLLECFHYQCQLQFQRLLLFFS